MPFQRFGTQVAIRIGSGDLQNADGGQLVRIAVGLITLLQMTFGLQLFEDAFEVDPRGTFNAEGFGNVALGGQGRVRGNPVKDLGFGGKLAHTPRLARAAGKLQGLCKARPDHPRVMQS